jgi:anti-anti-sigma regulatory factor
MDSSGLSAIADANLALAPPRAGLVLCNVPRALRRIFEILDLGHSIEVRG